MDENVEIFGLEAPGLPDGWTPLEACAVVKALDENGIVRLALRYTQGVSTWEALGMVRAADITISEDLRSQWRSEDD